MKTCIVDGCENPVRSGGSQYCEKHYYRIRRNGTTDTVKRLHQTVHSNGYILIPAKGHPLTVRHTGALEYEHRIVYYNEHGEGPFKCHWCGKTVTWDDMHVDHLNAKRDDNRIENLVASCPLCNQHRGIDKMRHTMRNKRATWIEYNGERKTAKEWADKIGITREALLDRIKQGWLIDRALTEPRGVTGPKRIHG